MLITVYIILNII